VTGRSPTLAAISLAPTGGGVAVVARLLWEVFQGEWGNHAHLLTLIGSERTRPSFTEKTLYALRLARTQATGETDLILFSHLGLAKPLLGVPRKWHRPYGVFLHGIEAWNPLPPEHVDLLAGADVRIANSRFTATRVMSAHPRIGPVVACPLGLPAGAAGAPASAHLETLLPPLGPHVVLAVGRMLASERYKGHDELIGAWPQVRAGVPDAQLVFVGHGDDVPRLRARAEQVEGRSIIFTGFVSPAALDAFYRRAALFALPSRGEGFGLVYLEAMAHRLPCLGSVHDAARDVIVDGQTGRLVDQNDGDALAAALVSLLNAPEQRLRMGEEGYRRLQEHFSFQSFAARFLTLVSPVREAIAS
jgi:phosphatidylinositol alpha-1,6-mannosyltransferase